MRRGLVTLVTVASLAAASVAGAQPAPLTLPQAVQLTVDHYPAVKAAAEKATAAVESVGVAHAAYLPRVDLLAQFNRATRNNVFGLLLPQPVIPSMSGPVLGDPDGTSVWGSAMGVLVNWEVFDFGLRSSNVAAAEAAGQRAEAAADGARLDVAAAAADAFLTVLALQQTVRAARAAAQRAKAIEQVADALVGAELRPGVDRERARAETALTEGQLVQAETAVALARASLAELTGVPPAALELNPGPLLGRPPAGDTASPAPDSHPAVREQDAARREAQAREAALSRSYVPRINLQGAAYSRATGAHTDGSTASGSGGLWPDTSNWAVGLTVTFPLLEGSATHAKREAERHRELAERARYAQVVQHLSTRLDQATTSLAAARTLLTLAGVRLQAARAAEQQASARYKAGLCAIVEVADAQRLLAQAETDEALATLNVWRARLAWSHASGDITPFLRDAGR